MKLQAMMCWGDVGQRHMGSIKDSAQDDGAYIACQAETSDKSELLEMLRLMMLS